jgi:hypothetical protein
MNFVGIDTPTMKDLLCYFGNEILADVKNYYWHFLGRTPSFVIIKIIFTFYHDKFLYPIY